MSARCCTPNETQCGPRQRDQSLYSHAQIRTDEVILTFRPKLPLNSIHTALHWPEKDGPEEKDQSLSWLFYLANQGTKPCLKTSKSFLFVTHSIQPKAGVTRGALMLLPFEKAEGVRINKHSTGKPSQR